MKKLLLITIMLVSFIFHGCGGGSSSDPSNENQTSSESSLREETPSAAQLSALTTTILEEVSKVIDEATQLEIETYVNNYNLRSKVSQQRALIDQKYTIEPKSYADLYRMLSMYALTQRSVSGALWASVIAVSLDPNDSDVLAQIGAVLNQLERYEEAKIYLLNSIELDFNNASAHMSLSICYEGLDDIERAIYEASVSLSLDYKNTIAIKNFSILYENIGQSEIALNILELSKIYNTEISSEIDMSDLIPLDLINLINGDFIQNSIIELPQGGNQEFVTEYMQCTQSHLDKISDITEDFTNIWDGYTNVYDNKLNEHMTPYIECASGCSIGDIGCPCNCANILLGLDVDSFEDLMDNVGGLNTQYKKDMLKGILPYEECAYDTYHQYLDNISQEEISWAHELKKFTSDVHYNTLVDIYNSRVRLIDTLLNSMGTRISLTQIACSDSAISSSESEEDNSIEDAIAEAEEAASSAKSDAVDDDKVEICIPFFCIGKSGGSYSFKVNAVFVSAKFSVDTNKMQLGIDAGIGLSDPTGNLGGISYELTSTINASLQTSIGIKASASAILGTKEVTFWEIRKRSNN